MPAEEPMSPSATNAGIDRLEARLAAAGPQELAAFAPRSADHRMPSVEAVAEAVSISLMGLVTRQRLGKVYRDTAAQLPAGWTLWAYIDDDYVQVDEETRLETPFVTAFPPVETALSLAQAWDVVRSLVHVPSIVDAEVLLASLQTVLETDDSDGSGIAAKGASFFNGIVNWLMPAPDPKPHERTTWHLQRLHVTEAQALLSGVSLPKVTVASLDTGYTAHPEIRDRIGAGRNFLNIFKKHDARDDLKGGLFDSHGTCGISVISSPAGRQQGTIGEAVEGIAPFVEIMPVRMTRSVVIIPGHSLLGTNKVAPAIRYAVKAGADIISMAIGSPFGWRELCNALEEACEAGVIVVAATGNVYPLVAYPAAHASVVAVTALDCIGKPLAWSGKGERADFCLPGGKVWCATSTRVVECRESTHDHRGLDECYTTHPSTGTTLATACTSGLAALWLARHGGRAEILKKYGMEKWRLPQAFLYHMKQSIDPNDCTPREFGYGVPRADELLKPELPAPDLLDREEGDFRKPCDRFWSIQAVREALASLSPAEMAYLFGEIMRSSEDLRHSQITMSEAMQQIVVHERAQPEGEAFTQEPAGHGEASILGTLRMRTLSQTLSRTLP